MNLQHLKYAVVVAQTGSINKAADKLYISQPNLSRSIKELENSLGVTIFDRSSKGMGLTPDGETFIGYAKSILKQVDTVEGLFRQNTVRRKRFTISVPRASYVTEAFARFSQQLNPDDEIEIFYKETNSMRAIKNILQEEYHLAILRYAENYELYYRTMMAENGLTGELISEFQYVLIMHESSPLATLDAITYDDLRELIEIAHADPYVPSLPFAEVKKEELPNNTNRRIFVFERSSQFELLTQNPECFMWVSPIPEALLKRYQLVQRSCNENQRRYRDVLIHREDYKLSDLDMLFIKELEKEHRLMKHHTTA